MLSYLRTIYEDRSREHEAIFVLWDDFWEYLGEVGIAYPFGGSFEQDRMITAALLEAGAPAWIRDASGWTDDSGWGLIGPEVEVSDVG
jgi:hypothetical protein